MNTLESILEKHAACLRGDPRGERANLNGANLPEEDLNGANLVTANLQGANLVRANLCGANLTGADLSGADLTRADLSDTNLSGANLTKADLTAANLSHANLTGADLTGADLTRAFGKFVTFQLGAHQAIFAGGYGSIGCLRHSYQEWLEKGEVIGRNSNYSDAEIQRYMKWIKDAVDWLLSDD